MFWQGWAPWSEGLCRGACTLFRNCHVECIDGSANPSAALGLLSVEVQRSCTTSRGGSFLKQQPSPINFELVSRSERDPRDHFCRDSTTRSAFPASSVPLEWRQPRDRPCFR